MIRLSIPVYLIKCRHTEILSTDDSEWCEGCMKWISARQRLKLGVGWDERYGIETEIMNGMRAFRKGRRDKCG